MFNFFFSSSEIEINDPSNMDVTTPQIEEMQFLFPGGANQDNKHPSEARLNILSIDQEFSRSSVIPKLSNFYRSRKKYILFNTFNLYP